VLLKGYDGHGISFMSRFMVLWWPEINLSAIGKVAELDVIGF
jgi:hypothetical protein